MSSRIMTDRMYLLDRTPGIGGFPRWKERELVLVAGPRARRYRDEVTGEATAFAYGRCRFLLRDGRLRDFQKLAGFDEAVEWIRQQPEAREAELAEAPTERVTT